LSEGLLEPTRLEAIQAEVDAGIERAVQSAMAAPDPAPEAALEDVFV
jgi:TPP-dependent pyruvate/acetoin dehydrogenase alpha subunit